MNTLRDILTACANQHGPGSDGARAVAKLSADVLDYPIKLQVTIVSGEHNDVYDIRIDDVFMNKNELEFSAYPDYNSKESV